MAHSIFAPSKAATWVNCAGAIALIERAKLPPERPNIHAADGTLTHRIAEVYLRCAASGNDGADIHEAAQYEPGKRVTVEGFEFVIDQERLDRADEYVQRVRARGGVQFYECHMDSLPWPGTGDAVIAQLDEHALEAHDLKDGNGIVYAKDNEQLICYLLLAWAEYGYLDDFQVFRGYIHQPKQNWFDEVQYTRAEMELFKQRFIDAYGAGEALRSAHPDDVRKRLTPGDKQCRWCPARAWCPAKNDVFKSTVESLPDVDAILTDDELGALLSLEAGIRAHFDSLRGEALARAKAGHHISGWKLTTGRQGPRAWSDADKASDALYEALQGDCWKKTLISPTDAQRKLKKHPDVWDSLQGLIVRSEGKDTLVPESDLRAPLDLPEFADLTGADLL